MPVTSEDRLRCVLKGVDRAIVEMLRCPKVHCESCRDLLSEMATIVRECMTSSELGNDPRLEVADRSGDGVDEVAGETPRP